MTSLPLTLAAAALALGLASTAQAAMSPRLTGAPSLVVKAGCYDECEYYLEALQEAREEAREAAQEAAEYAAEEAEEYGYRPRPMRRRQRVAKPARIERPAAKTVSKASEDAPATASGSKKAVAVNAPATCRQYSPATGMILSVPCE